MVTLRFRSLPTYISPQTSFRSLKLGFLTSHEKDVLDVFGLTDNSVSEIIIYLMRQPNMHPGQRLHFIEGLFQYHFPWLLDYMEMFWDYCKFHKFIFDHRDQCQNIFDYHNSKYYYPFQKKRCFVCEREAIKAEVKESKEQYLYFNSK